MPILETGIPARYVRVNILSAKDHDGGPRWASIRKATITVIQDGKQVRWQPPAAAPATDEFAAPGFDDKDWNDIPVPSNWEVLGYSKPTYFGPDDAVGLYRKTIDIPADWAGKKIYWHCDGCTDSAEVFVNGKKAGYHESGYTAFDLDLTPAIDPGKKNLLAVRVCKRTPSYDLDTGDYWFLGGIHRESHLLAVPVDHVEDMTVITAMAPEMRLGEVPHSPIPIQAGASSARWTVSTSFVIHGAPGHEVSIATKCLNPDGSPTGVQPAPGTGSFSGRADIAVNEKIKDDGTATVKFDTEVIGPNLWSAEKPTLYYILATIKSGDTSETVQQRFGFRQIDIKDGVLLLNGQPIKCCGTCRHEEWSALGHALTEHEWQTDIAMMKAANINAVRTSHYNHAERFLELCDEKGLYVLDEIPACWVSNKDPALKDAFVLHAKETLARDKNKPCVIAWSCGNESGWGPNFKAMVDYVAATDPTRPRFVSQVRKSQDPMLSFDDYHYPGDNDLRKMCTTPGPAVITEGPHIFYNVGHQAYDYGLNDLWGEALANQWDRVWPSKYLFGAFIWEWQDQGLADKYPDKGRDNPYNLRQENSKGIVTGYREPKPEWYHVKMVYSPVVTDQREVRVDGSDWTATFQNRYAFTDLSELICTWQAMQTGGPADVVTTNGVISVACPPGRSAVVRVPISFGDTLRIAFKDKNDVEVYAVRLRTSSYVPPQPPPVASSTVMVFKTSPDVFTIANANFLLELDRKTGLVSIDHSGKKVLAGPTLNLGELRPDDGDFGNKTEQWIGSKTPPVLKNIVVTGGNTQNGWRGTVTADVTLAEHPDAVLANLTYDMTVNGDGQIDWSYHVKWIAPDMQAWELGLKFDLPGEAKKFSWYRNAQWTEYPAGHAGADHGSAGPKDRAFKASKRNTVWAAVTDADQSGLVVLAAADPLHTRCWSRDGTTTLFASSAVSVDRDFSSGYVDYTRISFKTGRTYGGSFRMRVTAPVKP